MRSVRDLKSKIQNTGKQFTGPFIVGLIYFVKYQRLKIFTNFWNFFGNFFWKLFEIFLEFFLEFFGIFFGNFLEIFWNFCASASLSSNSRASRAIGNVACTEYRNSAKNFVI